MKSRRIRALTALVTLVLAFVGIVVAYPHALGAAGGTTSFTKSLTFGQNLYVNGSVSKGSGSFVIDHPLDPKNKLLYHSFVESPDMKNIYDGIVELDEKGQAVIELPLYFLALNRDFRYLATPIGNPMPELHMSTSIRRKTPLGGGLITFEVSGGIANGRVSWQVTGIRKDPLAELHPIVPEVEKSEDALVPAGEYLHPELY